MSVVDFVVLRLAKQFGPQIYPMVQDLSYEHTGFGSCVKDDVSLKCELAKAGEQISSHWAHQREIAQKFECAGEAGMISLGLVGSEHLRSI